MSRWGQFLPTGLQRSPGLWESLFEAFARVGASLFVLRLATDQSKFSRLLLYWVWQGATSISWEFLFGGEGFIKVRSIAEDLA
jgi:hypothetical protein